MITRTRVLKHSGRYSLGILSNLTVKLSARTFVQTPSNYQDKSGAPLDITIPWYLREENSSQVQQIDQVELPELPESAPDSLSKFVSLIAEEYGLVDIVVYDLAELPENHPKSVDQQSQDRYLILGTGKSQKHLYNVAYELRHFIKHNHDCLPAIEGMVSNSISKVARRRMAKRVSRGPPATHNTYGLEPNTWVTCQTGVDGIIIHMLTAERRRELSLENLYSEVPDAEAGRIVTRVDDNSIFSRFRFARGFHTTTRKFKANLLKVVYDEFVENGNTKSVVKFKKEFDDIFTGNSVEEYNRKLDFYKVLNLVDAKLVPEHQVENIFQEKYSSILVAQQQGINWPAEITNDVIKYMEYLLDVRDHYTPVEKLDKLSQFVSDITNFTGESVLLFSNDRFKSLLWDITCNSDYNQLDAAGIQKVINTKGEFEPIVGKVEQDAVIERNVRELIRRNIPNESIPLWLREQMMYTYGKIGNWGKFWKEFLIIIQSIGDNKDRVYFWVASAVFLSKVNNRDALRTFFTKYWNNDSGYAFVKDYVRNNDQFNSENEKAVFKRTVLDIKELYANSPWTNEAAQFVENL